MLGPLSSEDGDRRCYELGEALWGEDALGREGGEHNNNKVDVLYIHVMRALHTVRHRFYYNK